MMLSINVASYWAGNKCGYEDVLPIKFGTIYLVRTQSFPDTCAYQGFRNFSFLENFALVRNGWGLNKCFIHFFIKM